MEPEGLQPRRSHVDFQICQNMFDALNHCATAAFVDNPPFLLFDIANTYRENILSLDDIPRQVYVYWETYRLGWLTSFVEKLGNYVGYIFDKDVFLFHDGLPKTKPVLKKYIMSQIHGDILLLV